MEPHDFLWWPNIYKVERQFPQHHAFNEPHLPNKSMKTDDVEWAVVGDAGDQRNAFGEICIIKTKPIGRVGVEKIFLGKNKQY